MCANIPNYNADLCFFYILTNEMKMFHGLDDMVNLVNMDQNTFYGYLNSQRILSRVSRVKDLIVKLPRMNRLQRFTSIIEACAFI